MDSTTLLLVVLLIAVLVASGLLIVLMLRRPEERIGGLQRVLSNVKSRGVFGEVQLAGLLEQVFAPDQYASNVETVPGSNKPIAASAATSNTTRRSVVESIPPV